MSTRTVILGGGFGGLTVATKLREGLGPEHEIVVIDRRGFFFMGLRKLWAMVGLGSIEEGRRPLDALNQRGVRFLREEITKIDLAARRVETSDALLEYDYLVVALGAESRPDLVPGLAEHAYNLFDVESVTPRLVDEIRELRGGRVVLPVTGLPYKCPPAPYEATLLLESHLRERGIRDQVNLSFITMQPALLPNAGPAGSKRIADEFQRRGIEFQVQRKVKEIAAGRLLFEDGEESFDLCIATPPHRPPRVIKESGLTGEGEWVEPDPHTLETGHKHVFAIGDVTHIPLANGTALPKAGLFAEAHGKRVAAAILADITGTGEVRPFDGHGYCFLEMGDGLGTMVQANFFAQPEPDVVIRETAPEHAAAKRIFETERLEAWFGGQA